MVMTAIVVVFVIVWILRDSGWILHPGDLMCTQCSRPRRGQTGSNSYEQSPTLVRSSSKVRKGYAWIYLKGRN